MSTLLHDLRYAIRTARKAPAVSLAAIVALGLGIGANTAIFSVVNAVLLQPLPYPNPDRLVMIWESRPQQGDDMAPVSAGNFSDWRTRVTAFEDIGWSRDAMYSLTGMGEPENLIGYRFSANFLRVMGVQPMLGRGFRNEDDRPGAERVAILSHNLWQRRFSADRDVVGRNITLSGEPYAIIGVMPAGFDHPQDVDLWTPVSVPPSLMERRDLRFLRLVGRLKAGRTIEDAERELTRIYRELSSTHADVNTGVTARVVPLAEMRVGDVRPALIVMLVAVGFVLLIACANIANLLLAQAVSRHRELAVRLALGATRARILRQFVTESVLLAAVGAAAGLMLASWGVSGLVELFPRTISNLSIPRVNDIPIDVRVLLFTSFAALITGVLVGLLPAWQAGRQDLTEALKEGARGSGGGARSRNALVVVEVALALVLLVGATLMVRSFIRMQSGTLGFVPDRVLSLRILLPENKYGAPDAQRRFVRDTLEQVKVVPGVQAAGYTNFLPLSGWWGLREFRVEGRPEPAPGEMPSGDFRLATPDYFRAMGIRIVRGRGFTDRDTAETPRVAVVNETLARRHWTNGDAVGKRILLSGPGDTRVPHEIVGVIADVKSFGPEEETHPDLFFPIVQLPFPILGLAVRTSGDPAAVASVVRAAIWRVDPDQPVSHVLTMKQLAAEATALRRGSMILVASFAVLALVLAAIGIYSVMAYIVSQRTREIGIRVALGAERTAVLRLVVGHALQLGAIGTAIGIAAALLLTRSMQNVLFGVSATDPVTFIGIALLLPAIAVLASLIPGLRATRVDPLVALRSE